MFKTTALPSGARATGISLALCLSLCLGGCGAGSGAGLDAQGLPQGQTPPPTEEPPTGEPPTEEPETNGVTLAQLQTNIFGAICSRCHTGATAPRGLRLDSEDNSYAFLVNRAADEVPSLMRVNPGKPDESYIIRKLEGAADIVGSRMPLGGPYLSQAEIDQVRDWIANGAPRAGGDAGSTKVSRISAKPAGDGLMLELRFSRPLRAESLAPASVQLAAAGAGAGAKAKAQVPSLNPALLVDGQSLWLYLDQMPANPVDIHIQNTELTPLLDTRYQQIEGSGDPLQGGDIHYVYQP